jgi:outer membrane protein TolC
MNDLAPSAGTRPRAAHPPSRRGARRGAPPFGPRATAAATGLAVALTLAGCAGFSPDGGMTRVSELTRDATGQPVVYQRTEAEAGAARVRVDELLARPLSADGAVEVALLNHPALQAQFAALGVAEADRVQAGRLPNPVFSFWRLAGGGALELDRSVMFDVLGLLALPAKSELAQGRFEQAQLRAAVEAVSVATEAREAFADAVAAQALVAYAQQVSEAAQASDELARGMQQVGNLSRLDQMREQAFHAEATAQLARSRMQAVAARERLSRALGLAEGLAPAALPDHLPDPPAEDLALEDAERVAMARRLDVRMALRETEATARALGLTQATGFVDVLEAGWQDKRERGAPAEQGFEVQVTLPVFDFGDAARARAQSQYMQSVRRTAAVAVNARSQVREACAEWRTAHALALHYRDEVVPLRRRISDENLLRYNGMLIDVFQLLADAREQVASVVAAVEATRDFWLADARLQAALAGRSPGPSADAASSAALAE